MSKKTRYFHLLANVVNKDSPKLRLGDTSPEGHPRGIEEITFLRFWKLKAWYLVYDGIQAFKAYYRRR